ncbi:diguanylate cyclase [Actinomycetes bacterium KLBMP 9797]
MTLRGRLTTAFLAVVLGPVLLGAFFVGATFAAVSRDRSVERLDIAAATAGTSMGALCRQLYAAADAVALPATPEQRAAAANQVVTRGLAAAVRVDAFSTADPPARPWADCSAPTPGGAFPAVGVRVERRDAAGAVVGAVEAAARVDDAFVARLAAATGAAVTLRGGPTHTTESPAARAAVLQAADRVPPGAVSESAAGRYVRRLDPAPGQPLPLVLSVPRDEPQGRYAVLVGAVILAGLFAVLAAWWLARSTTRPLAELARAADRVAGGDLDARVPVRALDEVGRLAATFNGMTRETQAYVQALTASRDQLRGHLAVLGDTLSSTHDLHRILQVLLETARAATGARAGAVLLLDPAGGVLVPQCAEGLDGDWAELRVPLGRGLLGTVAATGEPRRGRVDRDGPVLSEHEPTCLTYVAVPFCRPAPVGDVEPPALGVLALYDRLGSDEFDDADLVTLRTFAGQAAVAVDNVRVHEEAQRLSLTDPLTGLWNYRYLKESMRREVERASRFGRMLTVLALDLDRFKEVNDTHGHAAGDAVLAEFARRIRAEVREVDLAFRQGGEEFVVLLPETDARGGVVVAARLGAAVRSSPIPIGPDAAIDVTVSIGIAVYPDHGFTGAQVLDAADDALYAAKAGGRDGYRIAAPGKRAPVLELSVPAGGAPPDDDLPRAGGASPGTPPPRQGRGR